MKLYYGLTNFHLLCCILHRYIYNGNEKCAFMASQGILKNRIKNLKESNIFEEVFYIEDTELRDNSFKELSIEKNFDFLEKISEQFRKKYAAILPFKLDAFDDIYLAANHGVFGLYVLASHKEYSYIEDGRGIYSNWDILDNLLKIKNPQLEIMCQYLNAYGRSELIKEKYIAFDSQREGYNLSKCIDFDINILIAELPKAQREQLFKIFEIKEFYEETETEKALVLTQRFSVYNKLNADDSLLLYSVLSDIFANCHKIYLKPHPADKTNYDLIFGNECIIDREMPSELIPYIMKSKFAVGICTFSSSINSLKPYIDEIYTIGDSIVEFKRYIFKFYALFELARLFDFYVETIEGNELFRLFMQKYNLNSVRKHIIIQEDIMEMNDNYLKITIRMENTGYKFKIRNEESFYIKVSDYGTRDKMLETTLVKEMTLSKIKIIIKVGKSNGSI